jgi:uncharacterized RDD family membrane protein YckC
MPTALHEPRAAASFPRRALAAFVDVALVAAASLALHLGLVRSLASSEAAPSSAIEWYLHLAAAVSLPLWLYHAASDASTRHATLGKRWLGLKVVHIYGGDVEWTRALVRTAFKLVPWELAHVALCFPEPVFGGHPLPMPRLLFASYVLLGLDLALTLMTLKKQSFHDLATGTYVVRETGER